MRVLIVGANESGYLAKYHEAFRTGLFALFDTRAFGEGYPGHDPSLVSYADVIERVFPEAPPDVMIVSVDHLPPPPGSGAFPYRVPLAGLEEVRIPKLFVLSDFWNVTETCPDAYLRWLERYGVALVLCYYPQPGRLFARTPLARRFAYLPPCFDPAVCKDWGAPREWDVGFLGGGVASPDPFYPERAAIHGRLLGRPDLRYLFKQHPGWGNHDARHAYVGAGFSRTLNACRAFVTTGGRYDCPYPKYVEALASRTALFGTEPEGHEALGLVDGESYVRITPENVLERLDHWLARPDELEALAERGQRLALARHTSYARALDFLDLVRERLPAVGAAGRRTLCEVRPVAARELTA